MQEWKTGLGCRGTAFGCFESRGLGETPGNRGGPPASSACHEQVSFRRPALTRSFPVLLQACAAPVLSAKRHRKPLGCDGKTQKNARRGKAATRGHRAL